MDGAPQVDAYSVGDLTRLEPYWRDLGARAGDPNPFAESAFLVPAARHLARAELTALCVWDGRGRTRLNALALMRPARTPFAIVDVWRSELAPLPALLVEPGKAGRCAGSDGGLDRARKAGGGRAWPRPMSTSNGAFAQGVARPSRPKTVLRLEASNVRQRAPRSIAVRREFRDHARRQAAQRMGAAQASARGSRQSRVLLVTEVLRRSKTFCALEASGWKGARGTAMTADAKRAAFAREMLARLSLRGLGCGSHGSRLIGARSPREPCSCPAPAPIYWKTAFDENFGEYSPGVQLTLAMSRDLEVRRRAVVGRFLRRREPSDDCSALDGADRRR